MNGNLAALNITAESIQRYDQRIPRYTSYPTAPMWSDEFGPQDWQTHLEQSGDLVDRLSIYVHIPFCEKRCLFCGCNVIITPKKEVSVAYLDVMEKEIALFSKFYQSDSPVVQLQLGGGTPNYLEAKQMARLIAMLESAFPFADDAERGIEVDPRVATPDVIHRLYEENGFRRISFGVQDFHPETQAAIGRGQTEEITFCNVEAARQAGFASVNIDLIYGLPEQTLASWRQTMDSVVRLRPDRIALYNFAYLPGLLRHQKKLDETKLPSPSEKLEMFFAAHDRLTAASWKFIGMDHYALENDTLTVAQQEGSLRRNFMGYTTLRGVDMAAFGVSSIADLQGAFAQNTKKLSEYQRWIEAGELPVLRGMKLSDDDRFRREVIEELMCHGRLDFHGAKPLPGERVQALVDREREQLKPLADDGLLTLDEDRLQVTDKGRLFLRNIAVVFDAYHRQPDADKPMYSRAV